MTFEEKLNEYIALLECTAKELSDASGLSPSVISRYRAGTRAPEPNSDSLHSLASGIVRLSDEKGLPGLTEDMVADTLTATLTEQVFPYERFQ